MKTDVLKNYKELIDYAIDNQPIEDNYYFRLNQNFVELLTKFCNDEVMIFNCYRVLKELARDLRYRKSKTFAIDNLLIVNLVEDLNDMLNTEVEILRYKITNPYLLEREVKKLNIPELLERTNPKIDLVQLIYAITKSINNGNATLKKIVLCFEFMFQVDLGNVSDSLDDFYTRKKDSPTKYLESLIRNFDKIIEEINKRRNK